MRKNKGEDIPPKPLKYLMKSLRIISALVIILGVIFFVINREKLTLEKIAQLSPQNKVYAALFLILLFILKSITIFFPIPILYLLTGFIFKSPLAIIINIAGAFSSLLLPYLIGRFSAGDIMDRYINKHPKAARFIESQKKNDFFLAYVLRVAGIFPYDIASMYMGSIRMPFWKYSLGSMTGIIPWLIAITVVGENITKPKSPEFIIATSCGIIISLLSLVIFKKMSKKDEK